MYEATAKVEKQCFILCEMLKFEEPILEEQAHSDKRLPHWQRHNQTPFYATAPRKRRK